jgi:hypothetical protein
MVFGSSMKVYSYSEARQQFAELRKVAATPGFCQQASIAQA